MTCISVHAQENSYFHIDKITIKEKTVKDSTNYQRYKSKALQQFQLNGYVGIHLKDSTLKNNGWHFYYDYKHKFSKITLETISGKKLKTKTTTNKNFVQALTQIDKEVRNLENNGYPFANVQFIEQIEEKEQLKLIYKIDSGDFFVIDKIHLKSQDKFHEKTVLNLIGLDVGQKYNEEKIATVKDLLSASKLYRLERPIEVIFRQGKAELFLFLKKEKSSNADGYIGFQQDQITSKLVLNGFINLALNNAFNRAEQLELHWKSNPDKTQNATANFSYPFLFHSPLGFGGDINLRKQDSTFFRTDLSISLKYYHPYARFSIFNQFESSSTLRETAPADYRNYQKNTIGATAQFIAPTIKSIPFYHPELFISGGFYNYRNDTIDDNKQKIANSKYSFRYKHTLDFFKFFHLNNTIQFEGLTSNIALSRNEFIYFGGLRSVRGFYELELSGKDIWMMLNEVEFRPIEVFSIFVLYDRSTFHNNSGFHFTNSIGFGFAFNTGGSALQIIIANGVLDNNPLQLSNTKIHIGFSANF
ncbi:hypothetical protein K6119_02930 [Paracrocinitomix mangrovi]|uniref:ShlB/FhaC/HecB family hemolysin secretion/activation protein n=1 Tax=Paracrocinitomix mangrovi TaxID=2862509 RepID=UPI001C8DD5EF|nr:ShlB/FhaC/HecB family hemolysin secretion/activation protein [Paracrocinitomix mangrovi]UKN02474.1 hypothetical protein K6119_02930 [Paracrocinitomix mangrovi]